MFTTDRLYLKPPSLEDLDDLYALQSDPDVMEYIGTGVRDREIVYQGLIKAIEHQDKHGYSLCSVFEKETGCFIGRAGLIHLGFDDTKEIEVAYALHKSSWGYGYATELAKNLIQWAFNYLNADRLAAVTKPANKRSRHVLEKSGMSYLRTDHYQGQEIAYYQILRSQ